MRVMVILSGRNIHLVADHCRLACVQWLVCKKCQEFVEFNEKA